MTNELKQNEEKQKENTERKEKKLDIQLEKW